jgi:hypothetical protein
VKYYKNMGRGVAAPSVSYPMVILFGISLLFEFDGEIVVTLGTVATAYGN